MKNKGFTLIELLTMIVILAGIIALAIPMVIDVINDSKDSTWTSNVSMIKKQIENNAESFEYTMSDICKHAETVVPEISKTKNTEVTCSNNTFTLTGTGQFEGKTATLVCKESKCKQCTSEEECDDMISLTLSNLILKNNPKQYTNPTLTTSINNTSDAHGLYKMSVTNGFGGKDGTTYYFRGNVENNYVSFAGKVWRVIRINEDESVRLILDERTDTSNHTFNSNYDNYSYMYYSNSSVKNDVESWYNTNITGNNASKVASGNYFCEAARSKSNANWESGRASMIVYYNYTPDLKCRTDGNSKGLINNCVGLITYDETVLAGGYSDESGLGYLYKNYNWWTMSPAGVSNYSDGAGEWVGSVYGNMEFSNFLNYVDTAIRPVINLKANVKATGSGTESDPYVVK